MVKPYSKEELYTYTPQGKYNSDAKELSFLLGGIGTGNFSIGARGELKDWEIFNWPGKKTIFPYAFFSIWSKQESAKEAVVKVLESRLHPPFTRSHGYLQQELANLPRLENSQITCEYPFATVEFQDHEIPAKIEMEAFTPFIPLNSNDSGIPGAIIRYKVKNTSSENLNVTIAGTLPNASGFEGYDVIGNLKLADKVKNEWREEGKIKGLYYQPENLEQTNLCYGNMAFMTTDENVTYKTQWIDGEWVDGAQDFWDDFTLDGKLEPTSSTDTIGCEFAQFHNYSFLVRKEKIGSIGIYKTLAPGEEKTFEFIISWYFPNRVKAWIEFDDDIENFKNNKYPSIKNYYATQFKDAWDAGSYLINNIEKLEKLSRNFQRAMFKETKLPNFVIEAITSNITTLRSNTCFRIEDGTFLGYEGIRDNVGCGLGSVPHVWNYEQTVAFLFPDLEQSMRKVEFEMETDESGQMATRMLRILGQEPYRMVPACDGQLGSIIRAYRDFKLTGDIAFLKSIWGNISNAMDYAFTKWDIDRDNVLDGQQNTTYDIEFYGPNPMTDFIFLAALKSCSNMAKILEDNDHYKKYLEAYESGSKLADEILFNGEYYEQISDRIETYRYQYGKGCLSDQLLGQFLAYVSGLSNILPYEHVKKAIKAVFKYNFKTDFYHTNSVHRAYAVNDEHGIVVCTWPRGGRPKFPLSYSGEVWTGIEYEVASNLIYNDFIEEGLTVVKSIRERYDGYKRNPYSEVESGYHYTRAMASWGLLIALSGFKYDMYEKKISFDPKINQDDFSTFWSTGTAWGIYRQHKDVQTGKRTFDIEVLYGDLKGVSVN